MSGLGLVESWWGLLALPACALIGLAFASIGFVCTTYMRSWADLEIVTTATVPLFLFSATFFPISSYGSWGWVVQLSPLYHGVALTRAANSGVWTASIPIHVAVLACISVVALAVAARRVENLLCK
jgi:lipooligosaccharide transport system permease protein